MMKSLKLMVKKSLTFVTAIVMAVCVVAVTACSDEGHGTFLESYEIYSGDSVTIEGKDITYRLSGDYENISVDETTGIFTFSVENNTQVLYVAFQNGVMVSETVVTCLSEEGAGTVSFINTSEWLVDGDTVSAACITESGSARSVIYSLKETVGGVAIDSSSGRVSFSSSVADGTQFMVVATASSGESANKTFKAAITSIVSADYLSFATEYGKTTDAVYRLSFPGVEGMDEISVSGVKNGTTSLDDSQYNYDDTAKTLTIYKDVFSALSVGEYTYSVVTSLNTLSVKVIVATKLLDSVEDLFAIAEDLSGYYVMTADIDMSDYVNGCLEKDADDPVWTPIGTYVDGGVSTPFSGTFDGNGFEVTNFYMNRSDPSWQLDSSTTFNAGFFGYIGSGAVVRNFGIRATSIQAKSYSGGFVGQNDGTIENCYIIAEEVGINGNYGGIFAGHNESTGTIKNCFAAGDIWSDNVSSQGAFVGFNTGTVSACYAALGDDTLSGALAATAFAGERSGTVSVECTDCILFSSIEELMGYDFTLLSDSWEKTENDYPKIVRKINF